MTSTQIRQQFLDFFAGKGHVFVPSSPVVPHDDPTIMFANAGMNQFKPIFLGIESPTDKRVANTQKCIRAGGKHNDLDDVGKDTYHHTFFEMLGNWSFGDYFKKEAIEWAWELLTRVWGIEKDRLHATVFGGDEDDGLPPDTEAERLWKEVTDINPAHVTRWGKKDNFWEMGETGPCGPCSEIHIDLTPDKSGAPLVNKGDPRVIELWNLVFIQFNRAGGGKLTPLPAKHVDTGLGFERLCSVLQGMEAGKLGQFSNYDTDVFVPIFEAIRKRTGAPEYRGMLPTDDPEPQASACANSPDSKPSPTVVDSRGLKPAAQRATREQDAGSAVRTRSRDHTQIMIDVSYRVIADHVRCLTFALTDGAIPSNEGRGYVLRRILRRAVRYGRQYMNMHEPFLCDLVQLVVILMAGAFSESRTAHGGKNIERVVDIIRDEEASFFKTLDQAMRYWFSIAGEAFRAYWASSVGHAFYAQVQKESKVGIQQSRFTWVDVQEPTKGLGEITPDTRFRIFPYAKPGDPMDDFKVQDLTREQVEKWCRTPPCIAGADAFKLHDTYGLPIDLTSQMAGELGFTIDIREYERLMEEAREKSRAGSSMDWAPVYAGIDPAIGQHRPIAPMPSLVGGHLTVPTDAEQRPEVGPTKDEAKYATDRLKACVKCFAVPNADGTLFVFTDNSVSKGARTGVILDKTCFYAEQGGQIGDRGRIIGESFSFNVVNTIRCDATVVHLGVVTSDDVKVGNSVECHVDPIRTKTKKNHTATHLLNWALREVLEFERTGKVDQKGSLVDPEKTRFDFSHNKPLTDQELNRIESLVNERIEADLPVYTKEVDQKKAREINTLRAVFGEKYPDRVRVVSIGANIDDMLADPKNEKWMQYSVEFCGGTHLKTTAQAERFTIITEEGVAKGIRRVVGISGDAAKEAITTGVALLAEAKALADQPPVREGPPRHHDALPNDQQSRDRKGADTPEPQASACANAQTVADLASALTKFQQKVINAVLSVQVRRELQTAIAELQRRVKEQEKERAAASGEAVIHHVASLLGSAEPIGGVTVVVCEVPSAPADKLRSAVDWIRNKTDASAVLLVTVSDKKVTLLAGMSKVVVKRGLKAGDLIREVVPLVGGKGGGRPDMAQGGGSDPGGVPSLLDRARTWIVAKLS